jgi:hypothetical protein
VGAVAFPILFFIIFDIIICVICSKQRKRLQFVNKSFLDTLDEKVVIYACDEEEFSSDNLEQMTLDIEGIIAKRMDNTDTIEVVTTPAVVEIEKNETDETELVDEIEEFEEPEQDEQLTLDLGDIVQEIDEEEVVAAAPITKEERENYLVVLITIVENAIADPAVKMSELEEIAELIYGSLDKFEDQEDIKILEECLSVLADVFFQNQ